MCSCELHIGVVTCMDMDVTMSSKTTARPGVTSQCKIQSMWCRTMTSWATIRKPTKQPNLKQDKEKHVLDHFQATFEIQSYSV